MRYSPAKSRLPALPGKTRNFRQFHKAFIWVKRETTPLANSIHRIDYPAPVATRLAAGVGIGAAMA
jgi:hypothetical protein